MLALSIGSLLQVDLVLFTDHEQQVQSQPVYLCLPRTVSKAAGLTRSMDTKSV